MQAANTTTLQDQANLLKSSLLTFTQVMYTARTGRKFISDSVPGRESHIITICKALMRVFKGECKRLIINVPPRYGKTETLIAFIAWCLSHHHDCNFIYVSYSHSLAKKQTETIREIINMMEYKDLFGVAVSDSSSAKDNFQTVSLSGKQGIGSVSARGSGGSVTGIGAGLQNVIGRFSGAIIIDDIIKPDEASSEVIREGINEWYYNTLQSRTNSPSTPIIFIGQRVHEDDLAGKLLATGEWESVVLPALDVAGNALNPAMHDVPMLKKMSKENPYVFSAQYQQNPIDDSSALFKKEWFILHDFEPTFLATFVCCDTAESLAEHADYTVFSHFGVYKIKIRDNDTDMYGLHVIDCLQERIEPKDLKNAFLDFWSKAMRTTCAPKLAAIEKASSGSTLLSVLKDIQGLQVIDIERKGKGANKAARFLEMQQYVASKQISFPTDGKHTQMCIEHLCKITANMAHKHDDICDTFADGIRVALRDKVIGNKESSMTNYQLIARSFNSSVKTLDNIKKRAYGR